jgi:serine/threonine protein kinase
VHVVRQPFQADQVRLVSGQASLLGLPHQQVLARQRFIRASTQKDKFDESLESLTYFLVAAMLEVGASRPLRVTQFTPSILEQAALASGLLTGEHLDRARQALAASPPQGPPPKRSALDSQERNRDALLGQQLVEMGYLNRWQVGQLLQGYTKFTLGSYQILDAIGKGGMGYVFLGKHTLLDRVEAIKVLPKDKTNPASIASFCHEIRALARLDHPNLVRLTYADKDGGTYFLVTEYVPGTNLRRLVHNHGPLSSQSAAMIFSQAAEGLLHAHQHGLVHRDVKPGNLMVTPEGLTKLTDLGLAAFSSEEPSPDSSDNCLPKKHHPIVGTPDYLAPEVITSPEDVRPVSDIYSLGCTLYYAVTGKVPFPGGDTSTKLRCHLEEMPLAPQRLNAELDDTLVEVIADMMRKSPDQRLSDASQVIERLRPLTGVSDPHLLREIGSLAETPGTVVGSSSSIADTTPVATDQLETGQPATAQLATAQLVTGDAPLKEAVAEAPAQEPPAPIFGRPLVLLVVTALAVAITAVVLVLTSG